MKKFRRTVLAVACFGAAWITVPFCAVASPDPLSAEETPASSSGTMSSARTGEPTTGQAILKSQWLKGVLISALAEQGVEVGPESLALTMPGNVAVPADADIQIERLSYQSIRRRFTAVLAISRHGRTLNRLSLAGRVQTTRQLPVLTHPVPVGQPIGVEDVTWRPVRNDATGEVYVSDPASLIGQTPRRNMYCLSKSCTYI